MKQIELGFEVEREFHRSTGDLDRDDPWFGRVQLQTENGETVTYRVGDRSHPQQKIVDWRDPASELFYQGREGDWVEIEVDGRAVEGRLKNRARVHTQGRRLQQIELFTEDGARTVELEQRSPFDSGLPDIRSLLSPEQYALISANRDQPVIVQGRAGSGKTTVALYRVSWLTFPQPHGPRPPVSADRVLIVMFNRALSAYVRELLGPLRLSEARIDTFHAWALDEIRRASRGTIEVQGDPLPDRDIASRVKRNLGMLDALEAFVDRQTARLYEWLADRLRPYAAAEIAHDLREADEPPVLGLRRSLHTVRSQRDEADGHDRQRLEQILLILGRAVARMTQYKEELLSLMTDRALLREHLTGVPPWDLDMAVRFQRALQTEGKKSGVKNHVTFEDFALLVRLIQLKHGGFPPEGESVEPRRFDHVVVDEAQDFGPVELAVLFASAKTPKDITIVGDLNQKIVVDADFIGWKRIAEKLGVDDAAVAHLEIAHRSTAPIMELADFILGREPVGGRRGPKPTIDLLEGERARTARIVERLELRWSEARRHLCVVCGQREDAQALFEQLEPELKARRIPVRRGHNRSFEFSPGVTVTNARQLKGLEFDTVVVVDPGAQAYPEDEDGRRLLYTVLTRAQNVLHLVSGVHPSPAIQGAIEAGLLHVVDETEVEPVRFSDDEEQPF